MIEEKSNMPQYGTCWTNSIKFAQEGCEKLSEFMQKDIALHLTNCFLEMSGQPTLDCINERTEGHKKLCMSAMSDRAFNVYTEFFTQTQNICYFLQNQVWHQETEATIHKLNTNSKLVNDQLEAANEVQEKLLKFQQEGLEIQKKLLDNGENLSKSLNYSKVTLEKLTNSLKESAVEHLNILHDLFKEFHLLHSWIIGRFEFIDKLGFYSGFLFIIILITTTNRTAASRFPLILNLSFSLITETILLQRIFGHSLFDNTILDYYTWSLRKIFLGFSFLILSSFAIRYEDKNEKYMKMLEEIKIQNSIIMNDILRLKIDRYNDNMKRHRSITPSSRDSRISCEPKISHQGLVHLENIPEDEIDNTLHKKTGAKHLETPLKQSNSKISDITSRYNLRDRITPVK